MKKIAVSCLLLLAMLCTLLPMTVGALANEPEGGAGGDTAQTNLTYEDLYVKKGMTVLLLAYDPANDGVVLEDGAGTWQNKITGKPLTSATLGGAATNIVGLHTITYPNEIVAEESVGLVSTKVHTDENGEPIFRATTTVYTDKSVAPDKDNRYVFTGDDGNTYVATKMELLIEAWDGTAYTTEGEVKMGGWFAEENGGIGYRLPDFYADGGFDTHYVRLGEELTALPEGEFTLEIVMNVGHGVLDTDGYNQTLSRYLIYEGDGNWATSFAMGGYRLYSRSSSSIGPKGTGSIMSGNITYHPKNEDSSDSYRIGGFAFPGQSDLTLTFEKAKDGSEWTYSAYKNASRIHSITTGTSKNTIGNVISYIPNADSEVRDFVALRNVPSTVYAIRVYDRTLTEAEKLQNHFADLAGYYGFDLSTVATLDDEKRAVLYSNLAPLTVGGDPTEALDAFNSSINAITYVPTQDDYDQLYVQDGLTVLMTAYAGKNENSVSIINGNGNWFNKIANKDGTYNKATLAGVVKTNEYFGEDGEAKSSTSGWKFGENGGVSYDLTLRQTAEITGAHYLEIGLGLVPTEEYTLQVVMSSSGLDLEGTERELKRPWMPDEGKPQEYFHERWGYMLRIGNYAMYSKQHIMGKDYGTASLDVFYTSYSDRGEWYNAGKDASFSKSIADAALSGTGIYNVTVNRSFPNKTDTQIEVKFRRDALNSFNGYTASGVNVTGENGTFRLMEDVAGTVYAIRVYDRALTEDELMQNHFADLCAYYQLDLTAFLSYVPEASRATVYRQWAKYTIDGQNKEDLQRALDESVAATFLKFDGYAVKTEGTDNELAAIFTVDENQINKYLGLNYSIEYGILMAKANDVSSLQDLVYGTTDNAIRFVKLYGSDGSGERKYIKEGEGTKTFGYSVFFDQYTDPIELAAPYYFRAYVRLVTPEGEVILAYLNASSPFKGEDTSFFNVVQYLKKNVDTYLENTKFAGIIENIYTPFNLYVDSVKGSDANNGKTALTPFQTVEAATAAAIEIINRDIPAEINIHFASGTMFLDQAIKLDGKNITGDTYKINYIGHKDGSTVIDGTLQVSGKDFQPYDDGIYVYTLPDSLKGIQFRNLQVDGKAASLAKTDWFVSKVDEYAFDDPITGERYWCIFVEPEALAGIIDPETLEPLSDDTSAEWFCRMQWYYACLRVVDIDWSKSNQIITGFNNKEKPEQVNYNATGYIALRLHKDDGDLFRRNHNSVGNLSRAGGFNYMLANNIAYLDEANEFYYDEEAGLLYYIPEEGKSISDLTFGIPLCEELVVLENIANITFENLSFTGTGSNHMTNHNHMSGQAASLKDTATTIEKGWLDDAAIQGRNVKGLTVTNCNFYQLEYHGIYLAGSVEDIDVVNNNFDVIGASAIAAPTTVYNVTFMNNYLHNIAEVYHNAVAIYFMQAKELDILYNSIVNCAYSGISVGWTWSWNREDYGESVNVLEVEVAYNYIENYMYFMYDGGAVYFNGGGAAPDYEFLFNSIHDNYAYIASREGHKITDNTSTAWYIDGGASHTYIFDNVVYVDEPSMTKWSYISLQGSNGWYYDLDKPAQQAYRVTAQDNYFINLYQDYLTTGYGRVKSIFNLYEHNSVIFTDKDLWELSAELNEIYLAGGKDQHGDDMKEYMLIDPDSFSQVIEDMTEAVNVYDIIAKAGCEARADRPLARADAIDLSDFYQKSVTNYKDAENDKSMQDSRYEDGDNVYFKDYFH